MRPELRDGTEALALNQDLHVEVGAPFLERTRDKLLERARAIVERCPELEYYFDDPTVTDAASRAAARNVGHMRCFQSANTFSKASSCGITLVF
jgi:hypothetical protein